MTLDHPWRLLGLLILPVLYWLALPPRPRRESLTAHLGQWQAALSRIGRRPVRFRRLRFWLLALAAGALALASAEPRVGARPGAAELVILLDDSASLGAVDELRGEPRDGPGAGPSTAFVRARARIAEVLAARPAGVEVRLARCAAEARIHRGTDEELLEALGEGPRCEGLRVDLAALARELAGDPARAVWTLTDARGGVDLPTDGGLTVTSGEFAGPNRGLVDLTLRDSWPLPDLRLDVQVLGPAGESPSLAVAGAAVPAQDAVATWDFDPSAGVWRGSLALRRVAGGVCSVEIAGPRDPLEADDLVRLPIPPPPAPRIGLLAAGVPDSSLGLAAEALADLAGGGEVVDGAAGGEFGLLLADDGTLIWPAGGRLWGFGSRFVGEGEPVSGPGTPRREPLAVDWDREHPLTRGVDLSELVVRAALAVEDLPSGPGVMPLIHSTAGPLLVAVERGDLRALVAAFRLGDSNLPLLPAFPQLLRRSLSWCYGVEGLLDRAGPLDGLLDREESDLSRSAGAEPGDLRPIPPLRDPGARLAVPLVLLAMLLLGIRVWA